MNYDLVEKLEQINRSIQGPSREPVQLQLRNHATNFTRLKLALELGGLFHGIVEEPRAEL